MMIFSTTSNFGLEAIKESDFRGRVTCDLENHFLKRSFSRLRWRTRDVWPSNYVKL